MAPVLQIGRMSVPASADAEWNAWYNNEYIPGDLKVPGVIAARRFRVVEGNVGYTTVYELENERVSESDDWKYQQANSSPNSERMRATMTHSPGWPACIGESSSRLTRATKIMRGWEEIEPRRAGGPAVDADHDSPVRRGKQPHSQRDARVL